MADWDDIAVVLLGLSAIGYAVQNAWKFTKVGSRLSRALAVNLCGEAVAGTVTLAFGTAQIAGFMQTLSPVEQNIMRMIILVGLIIPSVNLKRIVWQIEHEE